MIDQKFRIDAELPVQLLGVILRITRYIAHGIKSQAFQPSYRSSAHTPEIGQRSMVPKLFSIRSFIQFRNTYAVLVRGNMLRHDIHGNLAKEHIGSDTGRCRNTRIGQHITNDGHGKIVRGHFVDTEIIRNIQKNFVAGINMHIFRCDIFQINLIDIRTVTHISSHLRFGYNVIQLKSRIGIQFLRQIRFPFKFLRAEAFQTVGINHLYLLNHFKKSRSSRNTVRL